MQYVAIIGTFQASIKQRMFGATSGVDMALARMEIPDRGRCLMVFEQQFFAVLNKWLAQPWQEVRQPWGAAGEVCRGR